MKISKILAKEIEKSSAEIVIKPVPKKINHLTRVVEEQMKLLAHKSKPMKLS